MTRAARPDPFLYPPRGMEKAEAARYIGIGTTKFDELVGRGLPTITNYQAKSRAVWLTGFACVGRMFTVGVANHAGGSSAPCRAQ